MSNVAESEKCLGILKPLGKNVVMVKNGRQYLKFLPHVELNHYNSDRNEPPRVCRRQFGLSYAAMAVSSSIA
jgi:hypothetical protein